jgi:poly(A) polymerase
MAGAPDRLPIAPWMSAPPTRAVITALEAKGGPGCARFVGGCVRNVLVGRAIDDIDIATILTPEEVMAALTDAGVRYVPTGVEHGTVTAVAGGRPYEVTTLRRDVETDGRRAVVAYTTDWNEDAERRDFRLNALYMDAEGLIYDLTGAGVEDALAGRIIFVGDPETRIREDYLRILRFFRFRAWFGRGEPDAAGLEACAALKAGLERLSAERVSKELLKLLAAEDPRQAMGEMAGAGALAVILPEARPLARLDALVEIGRGLGEADAELRLAALLPGDPEAAGAAAQRLRLSNAQRERLEAAVPPDADIGVSMSDAKARRRLYVLGTRAFEDRLLLAWAERGGEGDAWRGLLQLARTWERPKFPLTGHDAAAAGLKPGPEVGQALRRVESYWIDHDFQPSREALLEQLRG